MGEKLQALSFWMQTEYAMLGRLAPYAASVLFAVAGFSHSVPLKVVAYILATTLAIMIALDLATQLLERDDAERRRPGIRARRIPLTPFQFCLAGAQAVIYTFLVFFGLGPATPLLFIVPVFAFSSLAAWRNVRLWYREGADFEDRLNELEEEKAGHHPSSVYGADQETSHPLTVYADMPPNRSNPHC